MGSVDDATSRNGPGWLVAMAVLVLVAGALTGFALFRGVSQVLADTPVSAEARGEPGCVTTAVYTGPDGIERSVDVRVYKANCLAADPGDTLRVYYDADHPQITAANRSWWWSLLGAGLGGGFVWLAGRSFVVTLQRLRR